VNQVNRHILFVEPAYYTRYPPLSLLKLAAKHKLQGDNVELVRGCHSGLKIPNKIYITSLFTYTWKPVHEVIAFYREEFPRANIIVGGIYATLCADHLQNTFKEQIEIQKGLIEEIDQILPDYSLVPEYETSMVFTSRGCIRDCPFCSVRLLEPEFQAYKSIRSLIYPKHKKITLWDNNFLASPYQKDIFEELYELGLEVDFNQGLDARLLTEEIAIYLKRLKLPIVRLAYDTKSIRKYLKKAIELLKMVGFRGRSIIVYCLYNFSDSPYDFFNRIKELMEWEVVAYPMRYEPLEPRQKNTYISPNWNYDSLEMIADARRVIGFGGSFPPYEGLRKKILNATTFEKAFRLRPPKKHSKVKGTKLKPNAG
jgi:hypothetical protein